MQVSQNEPVKLTEEIMQNRIKELYPLIKNPPKALENEEPDWDAEFKYTENCEEYNLLKHELTQFYRKKYFDKYVPQPIGEINTDVLKNPLKKKTVKKIQKT